MSTIIFYCLNFLHLPQYNTILKSGHHKVDTTKKSLCFGKGGIEICISWFIHPSNLIREKCTNLPKTHNLQNLVLIAEAEKKIRRNISVSNVYTFVHTDFRGV